MEAESVKDKGDGCSFNIYVYNVQLGIEINNKIGESKATTGQTSTENAIEKISDSSVYTQHGCLQVSQAGLIQRRGYGFIQQKSLSWKKRDIRLMRVASP